MDRELFDDLTRLVWATSSRRAALGALLGAALLGSKSPSAAAPKPKDKRQRKRKRKKGKAGEHRPCYPGTNCLTGQGRDNSGCDFSNATRFFEGDFSGSDFAGANFTGAEMAGANLSGADLGGACLVGTNLLQADLDGADLDGAIFCRTTMPDGSRNDSGCEEGTACCPTPPAVCPAGEVCEEECIATPGQICSIFGTPCCSGLACTSAILPLGLTTCESPCTTVTECKARYGDNYTCRIESNLCIFFPGALCCEEID